MKKEMPRQLIITNTITNQKWATVYNANELSDSKALNWLLSFVDPGDEYTVQFTNTTIIVDAEYTSF